MLPNCRSRRVWSVTPTFCLCVQHHAHCGWNTDYFSQICWWWVGVGGVASLQHLHLQAPACQFKAVNTQSRFGFDIVFVANWKRKKIECKSPSDEHGGVYCQLRTLNEAWFLFLWQLHAERPWRFGVFTCWIYQISGHWETHLKKKKKKENCRIFFFCCIHSSSSTGSSSSSSVGRSKAWADTKETGVDKRCVSHQLRHNLWLWLD